MSNVILCTLTKIYILEVPKYLAGNGAAKYWGCLRPHFLYIMFVWCSLQSSVQLQVGVCEKERKRKEGAA